MKLYKVTVSLNISSAHKLHYQVVARSITHAEQCTRHWDRVKVERIK